MSRGAVRRVLLGLAMAVVAPTPRPGHAQETEAALLQRIDSLLPLLEVAEAEAAVARARREEAERLAVATVTDTFAVGPLTVVTVPGNREMAERVYRTVWEGEYAPFVGTSPSLEESHFTFQWARELVPIPIEGPERRVELVRWRTASPEETLRHALGNALASDLGGTPMGRWGGGAVRAPANLQEVYRLLAVSPSKASRECLDGDTLSCWTALGLGLDDDPYPLDDWYAPDERVALVGRMWWRRGQEALRVACIERRDVPSCDALLEDHLSSRIADYWGTLELAPLPAQARGALLWIALQAGGEGAWRRLLEAPEATPTEALLHASGLSAEELAATWLEHVRANRPASQAGMGRSLLLALAWMLVFATLAVRSTRWRFA